jgi:outer membrane protein assembly factor BamB
VRFIVATMVGMLALSACAGGEAPASAFPGIIVEGKSAYLASNQHVYKFDAQSGAELWRFPATQDNANPRGPFSGEPLKFGDTIIIGGSTGSNGAYDRHLYALSDETGQEVWRFDPGQDGMEFVDGAVSDGKIIYAPNGNGYLYAIDPAQKENNQPKLLWKFPTENKLWSKPLLAEGKLYQGSFDHKLYAIDAANGKELWRFEASTAPIAVQPVLKDGVLYFGAFDSNFYAVNAADGTVKWKTTVDGWVWSNATLSSDSIFFGDVRGKLYALDLATGQRKWFFETQDSIKAQPVLDKNTLYVVSMDTNAYAFDFASVKPDSSGKVDSNATKWRNDTLGRRLASTPAQFEGTLLVPLFDGDIKAWSLDANTGARKFQFPLPPPPTATPGK